MNKPNTFLKDKREIKAKLYSSLKFKRFTHSGPENKMQLSHTKKIYIYHQIVDAVDPAVPWGEKKRQKKNMKNRKIVK